MPRLLASALSCSAAHGSEALVGFKYAGLLAQSWSVDVVAAASAIQPDNTRLHELDLGPVPFNEVPWSDWLRFERAQMKLVRSLQPMDAVFHITPSASYFPSMLTRLRLPTVTGPVLAAPPLPAAFDTWMRRQISGHSVSRLHPGRIYRAILSRVMNREAKRFPLLKHAKLILSGSEHTTRLLSDEFRNKVVTVKYAGIEHAEFIPPDERPQGRVTRLLYVGRVIPYKGVELLLRAVQVAAKQLPLTLDIIGGADPLYLEFCRSLAVELGIADRVTFHTRIARHDLIRYYRDCTIFCFPSLSETYGVALLEAMSCGCACIVADNSGPGEILPESCGLRIPMRDPDQAQADYANAIIELACRPELRAKFGAAARKHVQTHHDWDRILQAIQPVLTEALTFTSS